MFVDAADFWSAAFFILYSHFELVSESGFRI